MIRRPPRSTQSRSSAASDVYKRQIQEYQAVLTQQPYQEEALYHLATRFMQAQDFDQAQFMLTQLTEHHPQQTDAWLLLGRIAERQNQPSQALHAYQQVIQANAEHSEAHYNLGFLYQQQGNLPKAIEHFQRVSELNPQDAEAFLNLGVLFAGNHQFVEAEQAYQAGIALQPDSLEGHFNLGAFYEFHKKDLPQARIHYQKYIDLGGNDTRIQ